MTEARAREIAAHDCRTAVGRYGPGSEAWRLNREATILLGAGPRALLLQLAHPLIAEGVDQHSGFRDDPWGRLQATLRSYLAIVYGTEKEARAEIARLGRIHDAVRGAVRDEEARRHTGRATYSAREVDLALWVHATLVDSTIVAFDRWIEPLPLERREAFYRETLPVAAAFGIPDAIVPPSYEAFQAYLAGMVGPGGLVHVTPTARRLAQTILHPPLGSLAGPGALRQVLAAIPATAYDWLMWPAIALLPASVRREYAIAWSGRQRLVAAWLTQAFALWRRRLPASFRSMPQALRADRRVGGLPPAST